jgi:hypothetical protein
MPHPSRLLRTGSPPALLVGQEGWDVNRWYHRANSCLVIPKTGIMKINPESVAHFWRLKSDRRLTSFHQLPPAFHHEFTTKKPRSATRFCQNPCKNTKISPQKNVENSTQNLRVIGNSDKGKQETLTIRRFGPPRRLNCHKYRVNLLKRREIVCLQRPTSLRLVINVQKSETA